MPTYTRTQCIAFNVRPGTRQVGNKEEYLGHDDPVKDMEWRCKFMIGAIQTAYEKLRQQKLDKPSKVAKSVREKYQQLKESLHSSKNKVARRVGNAIDSSSTLKVFMAPEFYFRNKDGGYPIEQISEILPILRRETDKEIYKDWLFVFGTAIGYQKHDEPFVLPAPEEVTVPIKAVGVDSTGDQGMNVTDLPHCNWLDAQAREYVDATIADIFHYDDLHRLVIVLSGKHRIPDTGDVRIYFSDNSYRSMPVAHSEVSETRNQTTVSVMAPPSDPCFCGCPKHKPLAGQRKTLCNSCGHTHTSMAVGSTVTVDVTGAAASVALHPVEVDANKHYVVIKSTHKFRAGNWLMLRQSERRKVTEVFNVALVRKGGPAEGGRGNLKQAVVYKEHTSAIDYIGPLYGDHNRFHEDSGGGRVIEIHGETRAVMSTFGATDVKGALGGRPNVAGQTRRWRDSKGNEKTQTITEINRSGVGGGSVLTMDNVTFGVEICRDHCVSRLGDFYRTAAQSGDPKVQLHLIPSWGAAIDDGDIVGVKNVPVFNVDGNRSDSEVRIDRRRYSCPEGHPDVESGAVCIPCGTIYICRDCWKGGKHVRYKADGNCPDCNQPFISARTGLRPDHAPVTVLSTTPSKRPTGVAWGDYFKNIGQVVIYQKIALPPAEKVP